MADFFKLLGVCGVFLATTRGGLELEFEESCERVEERVGVRGEDSCSELSSRARDGRLLAGCGGREAGVPGEVEATGSCAEAAAASDDCLE